MFNVDISSTLYEMFSQKNSWIITETIVDQSSRNVGRSGCQEGLEWFEGLIWRQIPMKLILPSLTHSFFDPL